MTSKSTTSSEGAPPRPTHILETILYVKDMDASIAFYRDTLGFPAEPFVSDRLTSFPLGNTTLLLFKLGETSVDAHPRPEYTIPHHGPSAGILKQLRETNGGEVLKQHFCFAVPTRENVAAWEKYLEQERVKNLGVMDWERGGRSVYFADPDGHVGEIGSRGIWPHY